MGFLLCCLIGLNLPAATPTAQSNPWFLFQSWETADGLPENSATAMAQAPDGYLWFGTFNGLVRFNGVGFTVFNPANTPELPSAGIVNLHLDQGGRLWVSTYEGLVVGDTQAAPRFKRVEGWTGDYARTFADRANGDLLITSFNGKVFEHSGGELAQLPAPPGEPGQGYFGGVDEAGRWWVAQNRFIGYWENDQWVKAIDPPEVAADAVALGPARDGGLWLALGAELRKLQNGVEVRRITMTEHPGGIWSLSEDREGNVWIATHDQGICQVRPDHTMVRWDAARGLSDHGRVVFEDRERNLWVGTSGDGLMRFTTRRVQHFELVSGRKGVVVNAVSAAPEGGVWAATYGQGLFHLGDAGVTNAGPPGLTLDTPFLQSVLADQAGRLWVGTMGEALQLVAPDGIRSVPAEQVGGHNLIALFEDSLGCIWLSGGQTIARSDGTNFQIFGAADGLPPGAVRCFAEDTAGALWVSNGRGVFRREGEQPFVAMLDPEGRAIQNIGALAADATGALWLGSAADGLLRWQAGRLTRLGPDEGFPFSSVQSLVADDHGHLWLTARRQLVRARRSDLHAAADGRRGRIAFQVFDASDGLPGAEFTSGRQPAVARDRRGRLWFATTKGVAMMDPAALVLNDQPPPVHVEGLSYFRRAPDKLRRAAHRNHTEDVQVDQDGPFATPVKLPAGSRRIEIRYAALSLVAPERVSYQIMLEGQDAGWQDAGTVRAAYYHELAPRQYIFHVRAANNDGVWNEAGASLAFTMLPYYWQTTWFRVSVALLLLGAGGGVAWSWARLRLRRAAEREQAAHEIRDLAGRLINAQEGERMRLARELHDDLSQSLALLSVELEMFGQQPGGKPDLVNTRMREFSSQVKELSSDVHRISHELHPAKLEQLGLAAAVRGFCKELSLANEIAIRFESDELPAALPKQLALCLYRVVQEALQNVVKHSHATGATVQLTFRDGEVRLQIVDDGQGFDPATVQGGGSLGLVSMRERVRLVDGTLTVESKPGAGTRIEVRLMVPPQ